MRPEYMEIVRRWCMRIHNRNGIWGKTLVHMSVGGIWTTGKSFQRLTLGGLHRLLWTLPVNALVGLHRLLRTLPVNALVGLHRLLWTLPVNVFLADKRSQQQRWRLLLHHQ